MKADKLVTAGLMLLLAHAAPAQTADDYVAWGRASLAGTNVVAADAAFAYALILDPDHPTANALRAATRLLVLSSRPAGSNFLSRLGVSEAGRNIYNWTAEPPRDRRGDPVVPAGVNANEFPALLRTNVLAAVIAAEANLAKVTGTNFLLNLVAAETRAADVTLDYGDLQLLRAMLKAAEYLIYTTYSCNLDAPLTSIQSLVTNEHFTVERLLADYPNLFTFATTNDLSAAKQAFQQGADLYLAASRFIRNRPGGVTRLFNYDPDMAADEQNFRTTLIDLTNSLSGAVTLAVQTNYNVFLGSQFSGTHPWRGFLPDIVGNGFVLGSLPDPTFAGLITGLPVGDLEGFLARHLQPIPGISPVFSLGGGQFGFPLRVLKGRGYVVQYSTNLTAWSNFTAFVGRSDTHDFTDPDGRNFPQRFYRLVDRTENMPPPPNDNFANRILLSGLGITATGYNAGASSEPGEPGFPYSTAWWSWTAPIDGTVVVATVGSDSYPLVQIYTGSSLTGLTYVAQGDEPFSVVAGTTYEIQVDGGWPPPGSIKLTITMPPALAVFSPLDGDVRLGPADILISAAAADGDGSITRLAIHGDDELLGSTAGTSLSLTWSNVPPGYHYIAVSATDNLGVSTWAYLNLRVTPPNDAFSNRISFTGTSTIVTGLNMGAGKQPNEPNHAGYAGGSSVWWSWTAPSNGITLLSAWLYDEWGTLGYPLLGVYTGFPVSNLTAVASNAAPGYGMPAMVSFYATAGTNYRIAVDDRYGYQGGVFMKLMQPEFLPATVLLPGVPATNLFGATGSMTYFTGTVPPGISSAHISIQGGTGDCDLYVRFGALPTLTEWDYRPYQAGNDETVTLTNPAVGDWYIMLYGYDSYSGVTLVAY